MSSETPPRVYEVEEGTRAREQERQSDFERAERADVFWKMADFGVVGFGTLLLLFCHVFVKGNKTGRYPFSELCQKWKIDKLIDQSK